MSLRKTSKKNVEIVTLRHRHVSYVLEKPIGGSRSFHVVGENVVILELSLLLIKQSAFFSGSRVGASNILLL